MKGLGPYRRVMRANEHGEYSRVLESYHPKAVAARAVEFALKDLGYVEGNGNDTKYGKYWGQNNVPWCGMFVAFQWLKAGFEVTKELALQIDYVPQLVSLAENRRHGLFIVGRNRVRKGDAVSLFGKAHVELFHKWIDKKRGIFACVGGNTSKPGGSQDNGGEVCATIRYMSDVDAFVRMGKVRK